MQEGKGVVARMVKYFGGLGEVVRLCTTQQRNSPRGKDLVFFVHVMATRLGHFAISPALSQVEAVAR